MDNNTSNEGKPIWEREDYSVEPRPIETPADPYSPVFKQAQAAEVGYQSFYQQVQKKEEPAPYSILKPLISTVGTLMAAADFAYFIFLIFTLYTLTKANEAISSLSQTDQSQISSSTWTNMLGMNADKIYLVIIIQLAAGALLGVWTWWFYKANIYLEKHQDPLPIKRHTITSLAASIGVAVITIGVIIQLQTGDGSDQISTALKIMVTLAQLSVVLWLVAYIVASVALLKKTVQLKETGQRSERHFNTPNHLTTTNYPQQTPSASIEETGHSA